MAKQWPRTPVEARCSVCCQIGGGNVTQSGNTDRIALSIPVALGVTDLRTELFCVISTSTSEDCRFSSQMEEQLTILLLSKKNKNMEKIVDLGPRNIRYLRVYVIRYVTLQASVGFPSFTQSPRCSC